MDAYDNYAACQRITEFVDALSNWYVRRSRDRFWAASEHVAGQARRLLDALRVPADDDASWSRRSCRFWPRRCGRTWRWPPFGDRGPLESVHLCDYPGRRSGRRSTRCFRERMAAGARDRLAGPRRPHGGQAQGPPAAGPGRGGAGRPRATRPGWRSTRALICRRVERQAGRVHPQQADQYISYTVLPDLKRLGPRLGKRLPALGSCWPRPTPPRLLAELEAAGQGRLRAARRPGHARRRRRAGPLAGQAGLGRRAGPSVRGRAVDRAERRVDSRRAGPRVGPRRSRPAARRSTASTPTASPSAWSPIPPSCAAAVEQFRDYIMRETLATELGFEAIPGVEADQDQSRRF